MAYSKQTFVAGQTLTAANMNHIEQGIETLDVNKQEKLVSGTNIKTVNGQSLLGSGNIAVEGGSGGSSVTDVLLALDLTIMEVSADENGSGNEPDVTVSVTGLTLDLTTYSATVGDGFYINPVVSPSNATNKKVTWSSNATNVATVNTGGYVTAVSEGSAVITCTTVDGGFKATCSVTVSASSSGDEGGGDTGEGDEPVSGTKIQFSTLNRSAGGLKADGASHTLAGTYYVTIPYSEGMSIRTLWNTNWNISTYPAILVVQGSEHITPSYTTEGTFSIGGKVPTQVEATLTGYAEGSSVVVNMLIGSATEDVMDASDWLYYVGGAE